MKKLILFLVFVLLMAHMFCAPSYHNDYDDCTETTKYEVYSYNSYNPNIPAARSCMPVINHVLVTRQCFGGFWHTACIPNLSPLQYQFIWYVQNTMFDSVYHVVDASFGVLKTDTGAIILSNSMAPNAKYWHQGGRTFLKLVVVDRFDPDCDTFVSPALFVGAEGVFLPKDFSLQMTTGDTCGVGNRLTITTARGANHLDDSLFLESQIGGDVMSPRYLRADKFHVWDSSIVPPKKLFEIGKLAGERGVRLDTAITLADSLQGRRLGIYMQTSCNGGIGVWKKRGITVPYLDTCVAVVLPPDTVRDTTIVVPPDTTIVTPPDTITIPIDTSIIPVDTIVSGINEISKTKVWFSDGVLKTTLDGPITVLCTDLLGRSTMIVFEKQIYLRSVVPPGFYLMREADSKVIIRILVP